MRVLLVSHFFPPLSNSGTENYTYNLARILINQGNQVYVVHRDFAEKYGNYTIQCIHYNEIPILRINKYIYNEDFDKTYTDERIDQLFSKILEVINPDLVHINHLYFLSMGIINVIKLQNIPIIMTLHDYWLICPQIHLHKNYDLCFSKNKIDCASCIERQNYDLDPGLIIDRDSVAAEIMNKVDIFISPSQFLKNKFVEFFYVKSQSILHIRNGMYVDHQVNNNYLKQGDKITLGFFGYITQQKGLYILLKAFEMLDKNKFDLCIYGKLDAACGAILDNEFAWWRNYYKGEYNNFDSIQLMRNNIDVLIFPSIIYENYPTVINESLCAGIPVICGNIGGAQEMIEDNLTGYHYEYNESEDLIVKINLLNHEVINSMKHKLSKFQPYTYDEHVVEIYDVYNKYCSLKPQKNNIETNNSIDKLIKLLDFSDSKQFISYLYLDSGEGFHEKEHLQRLAAINDNDIYSVTFNLKNYKNIKRIFFSPVRNKLCRFRVKQIKVTMPDEIKIMKSSEVYSKMLNNGKEIADGFIEFDTMDPHILFSLPKDAKNLTIEGEIYFYKTVERIKYFTIKIFNFEFKTYRVGRFFTWLQEKAAKYFIY
jgi:glycosyltransferase involved in cell wall biosynthesis